MKHINKLSWQLKITLVSFTVIIFSTSILIYWLRFQQQKVIDQALNLADSVIVDHQKLESLVIYNQKLQESLKLLNSIPNYPTSLGTKAQEINQQLSSKLETLKTHLQRESEKQYQEATYLGQNVTNKLKKQSLSLKELQSLLPQLQKTIDLLTLIPEFLPLSKTVKPELEIYQNTLKELESKIELSQKAETQFKNAQKLAIKAVNLTQKPPYPISVWQQASSYWQEAISALKSIPENTQYYAQAQTKLRSYQQNYNSMQLRISNEEKAINNFESAKQYAINASQIVQNPPHSASVWKEATNQWEQAINLLKNIPNGTTISMEANKKLQQYQQNFYSVKQQFQKQQNEEKGQKYLQTAINLATEALTLPKKSPTFTQLKDAQTKWQKAIAFLKGIPNGTTVTQEAKKKIPDYEANYRKITKQIQTVIAESSVRKFMEDYFNFIINQGYYGTSYFCRETEILASSFFAPRQAEILDIMATNDFASVNVRLEPSNRGGTPIIANWSFYLGKESGNNLPDNWCIKLISER